MARDGQKDRPKDGRRDGRKDNAKTISLRLWRRITISRMTTRPPQLSSVEFVQGQETGDDRTHCTLGD
ncbi:hypothetical protein DPMN_099824 [Dreissena polymorpha]|uniref:Uncharacterized protein n=1 Tax=Dreissena polymorpha TaxID=45954 RepID=A0A9D4R7L1_DREPO|nr:hypothetical protein DPMN_099824 [Dreissena polymorpha]